MFQLLSIVCYLVLGGYCFAEWGFSLVAMFCLALFGSLLQLAFRVVYTLFLQEEAAKFAPLLVLNLLMWISWGIGLLIYGLFFDFPFLVAFVVVLIGIMIGFLMLIFATPDIEWYGLPVHITNPELTEIRDELKAIRTDLKHARDNQKAD